ncbi:MAG: AbrB/MazE/SpoVT family DNA-binding domain-containing protein [Candidatus Micrarchaeota archaeon]
MGKPKVSEKMFESTAVVGERGQITIPKSIRQKEGLRSKDLVVVRIEDNRIVIVKTRNKKQLEKEMAEGYQKQAKLALEMEDEWKYASKEADEMLDEY